MARGSALGRITTVIGGSGNDIDTGGSGIDTAVGAGSGSLSITPGQLIADGTDSLFGIERGELRGGPGPDILDASVFTGRVLEIGGGGNDTLTGGPVNDDLRGGNGTDSLVETGNTDMTLSDSLFTGMGSDHLSGIDAATLTGGVSNNTINASTFTGPATIQGLDGKLEYISQGDPVDLAFS